MCTRTSCIHVFVTRIHLGAAYIGFFTMLRHMLLPQPLSRPSASPLLRIPSYPSTSSLPLSRASNFPARLLAHPHCTPDMTLPGKHWKMLFRKGVRAVKSVGTSDGVGETVNSLKAPDSFMKMALSEERDVMVWSQTSDGGVGSGDRGGLAR